jgi:hypothetical protein
MTLSGETNLETPVRTEPHPTRFAIWKKACRVEPVISNFIDMLVAELEADQGPL